MIDTYLIDSIHTFRSRLRTHLATNNHTIRLQLRPLYGHLDFALSYNAIEKKEHSEITHIIIQKSPYWPTLAAFLYHLSEHYGIPNLGKKSTDHHVRAKELLHRLEEYLRHREKSTVLWIPYADIVCHQLAHADPELWANIAPLLFKLSSLHMMCMDTGLFPLPKYCQSQLWRYEPQEQQKQYLPLPPKMEAFIHYATQGHPTVYQQALHIQDSQSSLSNRLKRAFDILSPWYFSKLSRLSPQMNHILDQAMIQYRAFSIQEMIAYTNLPSTTLSSQLNRLIKQGYIGICHTKIPRKYYIKDTLCLLWRQWTFEEYPRPQDSLIWQESLHTLDQTSSELEWPEPEELTQTIPKKKRLQYWKEQWQLLQTKIEQAHARRELPPASIEENTRLTDSLWLSPDILKDPKIRQALSHDMNIILILSELDLVITEIIGSAWLLDRAKQHARHKSLSLDNLNHLEQITTDPDIEATVRIFFLLIYSICHSTIHLIPYTDTALLLLEHNLLPKQILQSICALQWAHISLQSGHPDKAHHFLNLAEETIETQLWLDVLKLYSAIQASDQNQAEILIHNTDFKMLSCEAHYYFLEKTRKTYDKRELTHRLEQLLHTYPNQTVLEKAYSYHLFSTPDSSALSYHYAMSALSKMPQDARLLWHIALLEYQLNDLSAAHQHLRQALQLAKTIPNLKTSYLLLSLLFNPENSKEKIDPDSHPVLAAYHALLKHNLGELTEVITNTEDPHLTLLYLAQFSIQHESSLITYRSWLKQHLEKKSFPGLSWLYSAITQEDLTYHTESDARLITTLKRLMTDKKNSLLFSLYCEHYTCHLNNKKLFL